MSTPRVRTARPAGEMIYAGGQHVVICPGDGWHLWYDTKYGEIISRERCASWHGRCPAAASRAEAKQ